MTESQIQSKCVMWLWNEHPETRGLFFAINNNSDNQVTGGTMKAMGVVPGVADCCFLWWGRAYFIEFKTPEGRQSKAQKEWQQTVGRENIGYRIIRSVEEFQEYINGIVKCWF